MIPQGQFMAESLREEYERHWGEIDDDQAKGLIRCRGCDEPRNFLLRFKGTFVKPVKEGKRKD